MGILRARQCHCLLKNAKVASLGFTVAPTPRMTFVVRVAEFSAKNVKVINLGFLLETR